MKNTSDKVFLATKPATNGTTTTTSTTAAAAANGGTTATTKPTTTNKSHLYNPNSRPPYRNHNQNRHNRRRRSLCCCCCFWIILIILILALIATICGVAVYVLYHPQRPTFTVPFLRVHRLNLTTATDSSSSHVSTLLNMTLYTKNPNSHITFFYDPFVLTALFKDTQLGNGSLPGFTSNKKDQRTFKGVLISGSNELESELVPSLRSDLKKKNGAPIRIQLDTKVKVKLGGLKLKKIRIRVRCSGIKGVAPKGKTPSVATTSGSKCKVDLRIKIWKWTF